MAQRPPSKIQIDLSVFEKEFLEKLDELEKKLDKTQGDTSAEDLAEQLKEAVTDLKKDLDEEEKKLIEEEPEVKEMLEALESGDMKQASKMLERLAKKLENPESFWFSSDVEYKPGLNQDQAPTSISGRFHSLIHAAFGKLKL